MTLIFVPIWILCLILCVTTVANGVSGIKNYKIVKNLLRDIPILEKNYQIRYQESSESVRQLYPINTQLYQNLGITNPDPCNSSMPQLAISKQEDKIFSLFQLPLYIAVFLIIPWIILRLIFWIKGADTDDKI